MIWGIYPMQKRGWPASRPPLFLLTRAQAPIVVENRREERPFEGPLATRVHPRLSPGFLVFGPFLTHCVLAGFDSSG
jgi:hypothetical protein